jgi:hypothetical protein
MPISISFTPSKRDLMWAAYAGVRARPIVFFTSVLFFVVLPWFGALIILTLGNPTSAWPAIVLIVVPPIAVASFASIPVRLFGDAPSLQGVHTYEFSESEIHLFGPGFDNRVKWSIVTHCVEFSGGLQIYSKKLAIISIPRRALSETTMSALRALLKAKGI